MPSNRRHGRNAQIYLSLTTGGVAVPVPFQAAWSLTKASDRDEVTAFGDQNKTYVGGLPDASGDFSGFLDAGTSQTYVAASDGLSRNMYLYWDATNDPSSYFYGAVLCDFSTDGAVSGPVNFKATWAAAGPVVRYTQWGGINT
jgi:hypothetical protein